MPTIVEELTGKLGHIETAGNDGALIYPNVQSCVAVAAHAGGTLVGAHVTTGDRRRLGDIRRALENLCPFPTFYLAGHLDRYEDLDAFGPGARMVKAPGIVDVMVKLVGGQVKVFMRPSVGIAGAASEVGFHAVEVSL
jgi:hypothetical protein